jgi:diguanylate cyclase (GGDEF)-like protein
MHEALDDQIEKARKSGESFTIVFLDLDYFKEVVDDHGHLIGSKVLGEVGRSIKRTLNPEDFGFRYGGDEFMVMAANTDKPEALKRGNQIRDVIKSTNYGKNFGLDIHITASIGLATFPVDADDKEGIILAADKAMYVVKYSTRDAIKQI